LENRHRQIEINQIAATGGRKYIDRRLWRHPNESNLSWFGTEISPDGKTPKSEAGTVGRKDRACCVNDAGRVVNKITQYLFKKSAERSGIDEDFKMDVSLRGDSMDEFWMDVNDKLTTSRWVWLQADTTAPEQADGDGASFTRQQKKDGGFKIRWRIWNALNVPDWRVGDDGKLDWIYVESLVRDDKDPDTPASEYVVRTQFKRVDGVVYKSTFSADVKHAAERDKPMVGWTEIPFVLVGKPSEDGWWFDDIEAMQAQNMNLDSVHSDNLMGCVYPQMVIPDSLVRNLETRVVETLSREGVKDGEKVGATVIREMIRGKDYPISETEHDKGTTRYVTPDPAALKIIPEERAAKRSFLFYTAGLALFNNESRQMQTAESKAFDHLDTESTLKNRALILQNAEKRLIALSMELDGDFAEYDPVWPQDFDVLDIPALTAMLATVSNSPDTTPSMRKMCMHIMVSLMDESFRFDEELLEDARDEIDATGGDAAPSPSS